MYPNNPSTNPLSQGGYVPYFYQSGLFLRYDHPRQASPSTHLWSSYSRYDFSNDEPVWTTRDSPQTVEQIIAHGYLAVPNGPPETTILSDKRHTAWLGLDDVITQIRHRYEVYDRNTYELDLAVTSTASFRA